ncbi:hypothetical protein HNQ60_000066 [Povalibacter uvarum]|uniref:Uncharacterized protein n=1 Tax=Povalibacter uvarum TaxID=732238 RepID=A0A841HFT9_9GAMM|nr:hypothetical protein [Povalibacter uvarum]MBB6091220.1 hypothetical protein [Povalibacter uvarum]
MPLKSMEVDESHAPIAAEKMHRRVLCYALRHWHTPGELDDLAMKTHAYLIRVPRICLRQTPWRCLFILSARTVRKLDHQRALPSLSIPDLLARVRETAAELRGTHGDVMRSTIGDDEHGSHGTHALSPSLREFYFAQARALLRCARVEADHGREGSLLAAHAAALWVMRYSALTLAQKWELGDWLCASHEHVRELLLACVDDVLLLMLRRKHPCTRTESSAARC